MITGNKIFEEINADLAAAEGATKQATIDDAMKKLDDTNNKLTEFQESVTKAFEKQIDEINSKILSASSAEVSTDTIDKINSEVEGE